LVEFLVFGGPVILVFEGTYGLQHSVKRSRP
jgi:hypothetical protein